MLTIENVYEELEWRGLNYQVTDPSLGKLLTTEKITVYAGFDPTGPSLTAGNLLQMIKLRWLQMAGHRPIAITGGGTGLIGDPSGKDEERPLAAKEEVDRRVSAHREEISKVLDFSPGPSQALLLNNADWLVPLKLVDFLRDIGKHFTVNWMMQKDSVRARLEDRKQGLSFTEFSFMLLQAYDFLYLFDNYECRLQIGGSDQWGNITAGIELIRRMRGATAYGLTSPLIEHGGRIMSKSSGTAVNLSPEATSPYRFYQHWLNVSDDDVVSYLKLFTFLPRKEIEALAEAVKASAPLRDAQKVLAWEVTRLVHGEAEAKAAKRASEALFGEGIWDLDEKTLLEVLEEAPTSALSRGRLEQVQLTELLAEVGLAPSKSAARADISSGGAYLNNRRETDPERVINRSDLLHGRYLLLRRGKKTYHLVRFA